MTAPSWPPDDRHPIEDWADHELIDQYRYVKGELAEEDPESEEGPIDALVQEMERRGLGSLAPDIEGDIGSAGRETEH